MNPSQLSRPATAGNESTTLLKLIALILMFCDHAGKMLLPHVPEMRMLGRLAFPLYCWCIVVGVCYTRSVPKYAARLLAVGVISQPLYNIALNHTWANPNVFLTLTLGLLALWGLKEHRFGSQVFLPAAALCAAVLTKTDYGWKGVLLMMLLYAARTSRPGIVAVMVSFCMFWGSSSSNVTTILGISTSSWGNLPAVGPLISPWLRLQALAVLSLPLILWHCPWKVRLPKQLMYAIYPLHLLLLWGLEQVF